MVCGCPEMPFRSRFRAEPAPGRAVRPEAGSYAPWFAPGAGWHPSTVAVVREGLFHAREGDDTHDFHSLCLDLAFTGLIPSAFGEPAIMGANHTC